MLPDVSPDVVHAMMLRFALAGELLVIICAQCRAPLYETSQHAGLRLYIGKYLSQSGCGRPLRTSCMAVTVSEYDEACTDVTCHG